MIKFIFVFGLIILVICSAILITGNIEYKNQVKFCVSQGGFVEQPSSRNYYVLLCSFFYMENETSAVYGGRYAPDKITNKEWADIMGRKVGDYCFHCWSHEDCANSFNDVLRERGVHC